MKKTLMQAIICMNLKAIMLSEIIKSQKDKYGMIPLIWGTRVIKIIETENRMVVVRSCGEEGCGDLFLKGIKF